jgi:hypothetical protein
MFLFFLLMMIFYLLIYECRNILNAFLVIFLLYSNFEIYTKKKEKFSFREVNNMFINI